MRAISPPASVPDATGPGASLPPPISDPEELVAVFTQLVEDARNPVLLERALGGAVRTARIPLSQRKRLAEVLAKRAEEQLHGWPSGLTGGDVRAMIASVAYTWATGKRGRTAYPMMAGEFALRRSSVDEHLAPITPTGVFGVRAIEAIHLIARGASAELLSEPTYESGAIDLDTLIERAQKAYGQLLGPQPPRYDLEMAALRLRHIHMPGGLDKLPRRVKDGLAHFARDVPTEIAPTVVAGRLQDRWGRQGDLVLLAKATAAGPERGIVRMLTSLEDPLASYERLTADSEYAIGFGACIATWPLIAPWHQELIASHLLRPLSRGLRPGKHDLASTAVACLANPGPLPGAIGHIALAMGCIGAEGDTRTAAADVFALVAGNGRLAPVLMAQACVELASAGVFQAKRAEATLRPLAWQPASATALAQILRLLLGPLIERGTRDLHVLVRLAATVGSTTGILPDDPRVAALVDRKGGGELVSAARALAAVRPQVGL